MKAWPRWAVYTGAAGMLLLAGIGACVSYLGPIDLNDNNPPKPKPEPEPIPPPRPVPPRPSPNQIWRTLLAPSSNVIKDVIELPEPMEINSNRRFIPVVAKCDNAVRWLVTSTTGPQIDVLESPLTNMIMIFPRPNADDTIAVLAYTAKDNLPTNSVITFIRVKADKPPPGPGPDPSPDPPAGKVSKLHVTYLLDFSRQTRAIADIINDRDLRRWLLDKGHKVHELSARDDLKKLGLEKFVQGKMLPLLIIQTQEETGVKEGQVLFVETLESIKQVQDVITKLTAE